MEKKNCVQGDRSLGHNAFKCKERGVESQGWLN